MNFLLVGDTHFRSDTPKCRRDDYQFAQWSKVRQIRELARKHSATVLQAGDLFHRWNPSVSLANRVIRELGKGLWRGIPGNHDLPQHNLSEMNRCGWWNVALSGAIEPGSCMDVTMTPFGEVPDPSGRILVIHEFVWSGRKPVHAAKSGNAKKILRKYPHEVILVGDNHKQFVVEYEGRTLVNPGSLMRMSADQEDHEPAVWLCTLKKSGHRLRRIPLEISDGVIDREYLDDAVNRAIQLDEFLEAVNSQVVSEKTLDGVLRQRLDGLEPEVKNLIMEALGR